MTQYSIVSEQDLERSKQDARQYEDKLLGEQLTAQFRSGLAARPVVEVVRDQGPVPVFRVNPRARVQAEEYRRLKDAVREAIERKWGRVIRAKQLGQYLDAADFREFCRAGRALEALRATRDMRMHGARSRKLRAILADVTGTVETKNGLFE